MGLPRPGHRPWITDTTSNLKDNPRSSRSIVLGIDQPAPGGVDVKASAASTWRAQHRTEREQTTQSNQPGRLDRPRSFRDDLPLAFGVTVSYRGPLGQKYPVDRYTLDLGMYAETLFPPKGLSQLVQDVAKVREELGRWRTGIRGLLVQTVDKRKQDRRDLRALYLHLLRNQGPKALARQIWLRALQRFGVR